MATSQTSRALPMAGVAIVFDRPDALYKAGEILAGWIDLQLKNDIRVKAMKLHVQGQARVSWDEKRTYTKGVSPTVCHKQSESILDHQVYLIKKDGNGCNTNSHAQAKRRHRKSLCFPLVASSEEPEGVVIAAGPHRFSFEYILPRNLPSSFEGKWGQIFYGVRFTMERPWKSTLERDRTFTVDSVLDFNDEPETMRPIYGSGEFSVMTCCFAGEVYLQTRVSRRGFVRGDTAPVHVEIYNNSDRTMRDTRISLVQHAIFRASSRIKKTSTALRSVRQGEIGPDQCRVWDVQLEIPPDVVPSSLRNDDWRGISVRYTISVSLSPSWWSSDFVLPVQIIVGTIGLRRETAQRYLSHLMAAASCSSSSLQVTPKRRPESHDYPEVGDGDFRSDSGDVAPKAGARFGDTLGGALGVGSAGSVPAASASAAILGLGAGTSSANRKLRGRQSVPCFSVPSTVVSAPAPGRLVKNRRSSAFELGAISKSVQEDCGPSSENRKLSSSLDTVAANRAKLTVRDAVQQRLKSVLEEDSDRVSGRSKISVTPEPSQSNTKAEAANTKADAANAESDAANTESDAANTESDAANMDVDAANTESNAANNDAEATNTVHNATSTDANASNNVHDAKNTDAEATHTDADAANTYADATSIDADAANTEADATSTVADAANTEADAVRSEPKVTWVVEKEKEPESACQLQPESAQETTSKPTSPGSNSQRTDFSDTS